MCDIAPTRILLKNDDKAGSVRMNEIQTMALPYRGVCIYGGGS